MLNYIPSSTAKCVYHVYHQNSTRWLPLTDNIPILFCLTHICHEFNLASCLLDELCLNELRLPSYTLGTDKLVVLVVEIEGICLIPIQWRIVASFSCHDHASEYLP